jgi:hypothetical protein
MLKICNTKYFTKLQTISYMAERIVGQGSFGVVFQVGCCTPKLPFVSFYTIMCYILLEFLCIALLIFTFCSNYN